MVLLNDLIKYDYRLPKTNRSYINISSIGLDLLFSKSLKNIFVLRTSSSPIQTCMRNFLLLIHSELHRLFVYGYRFPFVKIGIILQEYPVFQNKHFNPNYTTIREGWSREFRVRKWFYFVKTVHFFTFSQTKISWNRQNTLHPERRIWHVGVLTMEKFTNIALK